MPHHKAEKKSLRQNRRRRLRNKHYTTLIKSAIKRLRALFMEKKIDEATKEFKNFTSLVDKVASKGIIHKNKASRYKSNFSKKVNSIKEV